MWRESSTERSRQENQQGHETFSDSATRRLRVGNDIREEALHALHTEPSQDLGQALGGTLAINAGGVSLESAEQTRYEIGEVNLAKALNKSTKGLRSCSASLGHGVDEHHMNEREKFVQVRHEVLGVRK